MRNLLPRLAQAAALMLVSSSVAAAQSATAVDSLIQLLRQLDRSPWQAQISTAQVVRPGDTVRVLARVADGPRLRSDVDWKCWVVRTEDPSGRRVPVSLLDDGRHGDGRAADGVFGGSVVLRDAGYHEFLGIATTADGQQHTAWAPCEVVPFQDLLVAANDIRFSNDRPIAFDSVTIFATVHNHSEIPVRGVDVTVRALWSGFEEGIKLGSEHVDMPVGGQATVAVGWRAWESLDSVRIQVEVSPYALDEVDFRNNTASRWILVKRRPQPGEVSGARLFEPRPRPGGRAVEISFQLRSASPARLVVKDSTGRTLRIWRWPSLNPGPYSVTWDRRDSTGIRAGAGRYHCLLLVDGDWGRQQFRLADSDSPGH